MNGAIRLFYLFALVIITSSCVTYYQKNETLFNSISNGDYQKANQILSQDKKSIKSNNRLLYFFNRGVTSFMLGNYKESNDYFAQADRYIENYTNQVGYQALALVSNPSVKPYKPEDFESVMIHYYMSLNYLFMNNYEDAIVECRRLNIQLQRINDQYKKDKNRYTEDAFAHNLMGMIYEASGDYNNAFIAYRNAVETYEKVYQPLLGYTSPEALKDAVIRTAYLTGFASDARFYEEKFARTYASDTTENGTLVFFWMNGNSPRKSEWSINFVNSGYNDGFVTFADEMTGLTFPIFIGNKPSNEQSSFKDLSFVRVAFPKYISSEPQFKRAAIQTNDTTVSIELGEDINKLAFTCLHDRMVREIANSISRLAAKKALEALARKQNENLGTILSIVNAATEKADTRNWQSLPYSISYARLSLPPGHHTLKLVATGNSTSEETIEIDIEKGKTKFFVFHQH
jgi:hypothetical protein